jgi:hypothetical protein
LNIFEKFWVRILGNILFFITFFFHEKKLWWIRTPNIIFYFALSQKLKKKAMEADEQGSDIFMGIRTHN